jgi:hypothetical protein
LRGTLAELHEDLVWLREWADVDEQAQDAAGSGDPRGR